MLALLPDLPIHARTVAGDSIVVGAVVVDVLAGQDAAATRAANGRGDERVREEHALVDHELF